MEHRDKKIIVSADDFGISRLASEKILELVELGKIDRVEVMMSKNISPSYIKRLLLSGAKLDVHLHLAENELDFWQEHERKIENGAAMRGLKFVLRYMLGLTSVKKIEKEWEGQIDHFIRTFGRIPDGASSHEYIHFFPPYFNCVLRLCKKFNIRYIRFGKNNSINHSAISKILNWLRAKNLKNFNQSGLASSDLMLSFDWMSDLESGLRPYASNSSVEIVFHPEKDVEFDVLADFNKVA
jgi:predicted glycoside hydrolase/deacetylase ChbG (UPF0249 family)